MKTKLTGLIPVALLVLALPLLLANSLPSGKKLNCSGTWILNEQKSDFGEYGRMMASDKMIIVQKGKKLTMEKFGTAPTGESYNYTENYTLDGKECFNQILDIIKKTSIVTWTDKKSSLTINTDQVINWEGNEMKMKTIEIISLEDGGKSLIIKSTTSTEYGDMAVSFIYDKE